MISLSDLAAAVGGRLTGPDPGASVEGVSSLQDAGPSEICYYGNPRYRKQLAETRALAVIVDREVPTSSPHLILVEKAYEAFRIALGMFAPDRASCFRGVSPAAVIADSARLEPGVSIGPCAVVDRDVSISAGTTVGAGCYIGPRVRIGRDCAIAPRVVLLAETEIGDRVIIASGAVLGSDGFGFVPDASGHRKVPQNGRVVVEDDVEIGANCCIDRAVIGATVIGRFTKLDNLIHIAHNVTVGPGCLVAAQVGVAGSTAIGSGVVFGGQAGINGHITIGDGAVIAAQAGVTKDVVAGVTVSGYPARPHARALRVDAAVSRLPEFMEDVGRKLGGNAGKEEEPDK